MTYSINDEIARQAELGVTSPLHAVRAVETIRRLTQQVPQRAIAQGPAVVSPTDFDPARWAAAPARQAAPIAGNEALTMPAVLAPTQYPAAVDARNHPPSYAQTVQPQMAPTLWLTVPNIPTIAPQQESPGERLDFSLGDGILIGMRGSVLVWDPVALLPVTEDRLKVICGVKLSINGQEQLIVDGASESWAWFSDLFVPGPQWSPVQRHVLSSDILTVRFYNRAPVGGPSIKPSLMFGYRRLPMPIHPL